MSEAQPVSREALTEHLIRAAIRANTGHVDVLIDNFVSSLREDHFIKPKNEESEAMSADIRKLYDDPAVVQAMAVLKKHAITGAQFEQWCSTYDHASLGKSPAEELER